VALRGREEPEGLVDGQPQADPSEVAREIALRLLSVRARSQAELEDAMRRRGVPEGAMRQVIDRFSELGLVDDRAFSKMWVEGQQRRMRSARALRHELREKGISNEVIDEALDSVGGEEEYSAALALARKRAYATRTLPVEVRRRRILGALARRGFPSGIAYRAVDEALTEVD
jgi:regulatory protein